MNDFKAQLYQCSVEHAAADYQRAVELLRHAVDQLNDNPTPELLANLCRDSGEVVIAGGRLYALRETAYLVGGNQEAEK